MLFDLPVYEPSVGAMCPHGLPDCLCDVVVTNPVPIAVGIKHDWHQFVLDAMDADTVSARNLYQFLTHVLGCFELLNFLEGDPEPVLRNCEICAGPLPDYDERRTTCSNKCRSKKRRLKQKGLLNAVR